MQWKLKQGNYAIYFGQNKSEIAITNYEQKKLRKEDVLCKMYQDFFQKSNH